MMQPALHFDTQLLLRAQPVKVVFLDVDGVFTDGGLYYSDSGETLKRFHVLDGQGIKLLGKIGVTPVVITGRDSAALRVRLSNLGITQAHYGTEAKLPVAEAVLKGMNLTWADAAAMGDDWPDLPLLKRAELACVPPNGHIEARHLAHHITQARGGHGAVRELCDLLLVASGQYASLYDQALQ